MDDREGLPCERSSLLLPVPPLAGLYDFQERWFCIRSSQFRKPAEVMLASPVSGRQPLRETGMNRKKL